MLCAQPRFHFSVRPEPVSRVLYPRPQSFLLGPVRWLRCTIFAGEWPLWDPYVGGGQSAVADALHQMFLLPVLAVRLIGSEVVGFNLWVALPFPMAAIGAWAFLRRRFSAPASALGAIAFSVAGPVVSTGNFPNMSWSVAAMPWMLWAADRAVSAPSARRHSVLALVVAFQALAGEPVTLFATLVLTVAFAAVVASPPDRANRWRQWRHAMWVMPGLALGLALAAIQLIPMALAARLAERSNVTGRDFWSLHPLGLLETVARSLYGDFYSSQSLASVPWMPLLNGGREPFFYLLTLGTPSRAGAAGTDCWKVSHVVDLLDRRRRNRTRRRLRRPYACLPVCPGSLASARMVQVSRQVFRRLLDCRGVLRRRRMGRDHRRRRDGSRDSLAPPRTECGRRVCARRGPRLLHRCRRLHLFHDTNGVPLLFDREVARSAGSRGGRRVHVEGDATPGDLVDVVVARNSRADLPGHRRAPGSARGGPPSLRADRRGPGGARLGLNPTFDVSHLSEPEWLSRTKAQSDVRFYVGGKHDGTLDARDLDSSRAFLNPPGLSGSASRAALSGQAAFYPSAWRGREMLSYDLPVLWPRSFQLGTEQFFAAGRDARD